MKVLSRVILFVIIPVTVGCGLIHVIRNRDAAPDQSPARQSVDKGPTTAPKAPHAQPETPPKPRMPIGIDDYRIVNSPLPHALKPLAAELGAGILVAPQRKLILWGKNDTKTMPIASMTKMMTILVALERMEAEPTLDLKTVIQVTKAAERAGGRRVWLAAGHRYSAETLMKTSLMYSANDASHAVAVGLAPNHDVRKFLVMMNRRARTLGMKRALFFNVHGMPEKRDNQATPRDLVVLALALQKYPKVSEWSQLRKDRFVHNNGKIVNLKNTNVDLLTRCNGVTGLKTGYTDRAGSCVTATCIRDGEFLIAVTCGFHTKKVGPKGKNKRFTFVSGLLDWGFQVTKVIDAKGL